MPGQATRFLVDLFELDPPQFAPADVGDPAQLDAIKVLKEAGALVEAAPRFQLQCSACDEGHDVEVGRAPGGGYEAFCKSVGMYPVPADHLRQLRADAAWLVNHIRERVGLPPMSRGSVNDDGVVHVAKVRFGPYRCELFVAFRITSIQRAEQAGEILRCWAGSSPMIVLTTTELALVPAVARVGMVALADVLDLDDGRNGFDETPILAVLRPPRDPTNVKAGFAHSPDFRTVRWSDQTFDFTPKQALVVEALYEAWFDGTLKRSQAVLQGRGVGQRMTELFRDHPAYGTFILHDGQGFYWLDL
ncbi:MAG: hypothetical protein KIS68_12645 [Bauldia sp.]|nr:hypothetical protein [Bauldia sp.]